MKLRWCRNFPDSHWRIRARRLFKLKQSPLYSIRKSVWRVKNCPRRVRSPDRTRAREGRDANCNRRISNHRRVSIHAPARGATVIYLTHYDVVNYPGSCADPGKNHSSSMSKNDYRCLQSVFQQLTPHNYHVRFG